MSGFLHLGDLIYESAAVAFDTNSQLWVNPQAGTTYGPNVPAGFVDIPDSQKHPVNVTGSAVPVFRANGGGTQANPNPGDQWINPDGSVNSTFTTAGIWQSGASSTLATATVAAPAAASAPPASPTPSGTDFIYTIPSTNATIDLTTLWKNYWWAILAGGGALYMFTRRGRG